MGFISEQVRKIAELQENLECVSILREAADTIESLSAKLQAANMERSAEDCDGWIPCSQRLPEEHDSMFAKLKGTDKWNNAMFERISDNVNVTVEFEDGQRKAITLHTVDGKWKRDSIVKFEVVAWQPLPEPYNPDRSSP